MLVTLYRAKYNRKGNVVNYQYHSFVLFDSGSDFITDANPEELTTDVLRTVNESLLGFDGVEDVVINNQVVDNKYKIGITVYVDVNAMLAANYNNQLKKLVNDLFETHFFYLLKLELDVVFRSEGMYF